MNKNYKASKFNADIFRQLAIARRNHHYGLELKLINEYYDNRLDSIIKDSEQNEINIDKIDMEYFKDRLLKEKEITLNEIIKKRLIGE